MGRKSFVRLLLIKFSWKSRGYAFILFKHRSGGQRQEAPAEATGQPDYLTHEPMDEIPAPTLKFKK